MKICIFGGNGFIGSSLAKEYLKRGHEVFIYTQTKIKNILEIYIAEKFIGERGRINCSLKEKNNFWRWLGIQYVISDK